MRRIGGDQQDLLAHPTGGECHRGGAGRLADAALASEEQYLSIDELTHAAGIRKLAAGKIADRRAIHAHAAMPEMKLSSR